MLNVLGLINSQYNTNGLRQLKNKIEKSNFLPLLTKQETKYNIITSSMTSYILFKQKTFISLLSE